MTAAVSRHGTLLAGHPASTHRMTADTATLGNVWRNMTTPRLEALLDGQLKEHV
jgi:hypothetical protein